jgi:hypothetical protein
MKVNAWIPLTADPSIRRTVEANIAKYGRVFAVGYAGDYFNVYGELPEQFVKQLESFQSRFNFLVSRGSSTPDFVHRGSGR